MQVPTSMPKGRKGKTTSGSGTHWCAHAGGTVQSRKERKENRENQRKETTALWWRKDVWVWHLQHSQIKWACHALWMVRDWLSLRSLRPATILSYPVLTTAGCKTFETLTMPLQVSWKTEVDRNRYKIRRSTTDEKKEVKVSRRVPTAVPLLLMMSTVKRKKENTRQTQNKKQLEWYLPNNVVCLP